MFSFEYFTKNFVSLVAHDIDSLMCFDSVFLIELENSHFL